MKKHEMMLPGYVAECLEALERAGYACYAVGGCVRDACLGKTPQDYDLCTSATPESMRTVFAKYPQILAGEKHGTVGVITDGGVVEITTFRTEGGYQDNRHPDWVKFVEDIHQDLARRDFTVNAMAYSPEKGLIDPFGGQEDLQKKILRAVGDPSTRFREDALRILRGMRFSVTYNLTPEEETLKSMIQCAAGLETVARERIFEELCKFLLKAKATDILRYAPILTRVLPPLAPAMGFLQHSPHHAYDVYTHTAYVVESVGEALALRWAALLHDVGKVAAFTMDENGRGHFYGHAQISAEMADDLLLALKAPTALRRQVTELIRRHMQELPADKKSMRRQLSKLGQETFEQLLTLQKADFCSKGVDGNLEEFLRAEDLLREILEETPCLTAKDLAVNGQDMMALGLKGKDIGAMLEKLLQMVLEEQLPNEKTALLQAAKKEI